MTRTDSAARLVAASPAVVYDALVGLASSLDNLARWVDQAGTQQSR